MAMVPQPARALLPLDNPRTVVKQQEPDQLLFFYFEIRKLPSVASLVKSDLTNFLLR